MIYFIYLSILFPLDAIFFMTYFHRAGVGHSPLGPPLGSATGIPVGCVPSAAVAVGGMSAPVHAGICVPMGDVCPSASRDMSAQGIVCASACWNTPTPVNRTTDRQV